MTLPTPGQKEPDDVSGYIVCQSPTFNIFLGARLTDEDPASAKQTLAQLKMYPYAQRDNPPPMDILDVGTRAWSGAPPRGLEYWQRLDDVIQREPVEPRDVFFHAMLRPLGLEKGKPFKPDARQTQILTEAALVGEAMARPTPRSGGSRTSGIDPTRTGISRCGSTPTTRPTSGISSTSAPPGSTRPSARALRWRPSGRVHRQRT